MPYRNIILHVGVFVIVVWGFIVRQHMHVLSWDLLVWVNIDTSVRSCVFCWHLCYFDTKFCYASGGVCFVMVFVNRWGYVLIRYKLYALLGDRLSWFDLCSYVWRFLCCQNLIFLIRMLSPLSLLISFLCEMFFLLRRYFCCWDAVLFIEI